MGRIEVVVDLLFRLFSGTFDNYQQCDTKYHDLDHTLQLVEPFVDIIDGWNRAGEGPKVSFPFFELGITAVFLHDTGYIKERGDRAGSGAKYTFVHIDRSIAFAGRHLPLLGFSSSEVLSVQKMINCTGVIERINGIDFSSDEERICGFALGTADIVGQMSAANYPQKLTHLFDEFTEGYDHEGRDALRKRGVELFPSLHALKMNTPAFYSGPVRTRLNHMGSLDRYASAAPGKRKTYATAIEKNLRILADLTDGRPDRLGG